MDLNSKKIVFIDLDGTLIKTKSGSKFPKGVWDMDLNLKVFEQLKKMQPSAIFIVSNQGGIQLNLIPKQLFVNKFMYILSVVFTNIYSFASALSKLFPSYIFPSLMLKFG